MTKPFVTNDLWATIEPLLPAKPPKRLGERPRCDDQPALSGIVFVLRPGILMEHRDETPRGRILMIRRPPATGLVAQIACRPEFPF